MVWSEAGEQGPFSTVHAVHAALLLGAVQPFMPGTHSPPFLSLSPFVLAGGFDQPHSGGPEPAGLPVPFCWVAAREPGLGRGFPVEPASPGAVELWAWSSAGTFRWAQPACPLQRLTDQKSSQTALLPWTGPEVGQKARVTAPRCDTSPGESEVGLCADT